GVLILWIAPGVAALGMSVMVRVSARARTAQEANQLGGSVILPLIFVAVAQSAGLLLIPVGAAFAVGAAVWALAIWLLLGRALRPDQPVILHPAYIDDVIEQEAEAAGISLCLGKIEGLNTLEREIRRLCAALF